MFFYVGKVGVYISEFVDCVNIELAWNYTIILRY